jgi:hypothetical protein
MEIYHNVSINAHADDPFYLEIERLQIEHKNAPLPGDPLGLVTFSIAESDPRWPIIQQQIALYGAADIIGTKFSLEEIENSEWSRFVVLYEWGYPQPEKHHKWVEQTYQNYCPQCGAGYKQIKPFLLAKEPRLGRQQFFSLYWTPALFCTKEVLREFEINGIKGFESWDPITRPTHQASHLVSQLIIPSVTAPGLASADKIRPETCLQCGLTKYAHHRRGKMGYRRDSLRTDVDIQALNEWFGSGSHISFQEFIVSNRLARLIMTKGWRGIALQPIELI